jgi:hypothetical protein
MRHLIQDKILIRKPNLASFPVVGDALFFYLDDSTKLFYYWNGTNYISLSSVSPSNNTDYNNNFLLMGG